MAAEERQEEQRFLAELKARSGRTLADWMALITVQNFSDKNETIDWLRSQGFSFARASWLERIHSNGGRPIYAHAPAVPAGADTAGSAPHQGTSSEPEVQARSAETAPSDGDDAAMEKLIAAAKGYRPLYHLLEAGIRKAIPETTFAPRASYISLRAPAEFAAVAPHAGGLRLGLDLGE